MTSRKSGNVFKTFDCLKLYFIKQIRVCHVELTTTMIICNYRRWSITFKNNMLIFIIQFPSTAYTRAYRCIWYLTSGAPGFEFRFCEISTLREILQPIRIWQWPLRFNALSQMNIFGDYDIQKKLKEDKNKALRI